MYSLCVLFIAFVAVSSNTQIPYEAVTKVLIISSNHFDAGFGLGPHCSGSEQEGPHCTNKAYTVAVVNEYFNYWFPGILNTANDLKAQNISFKYTTQPWLVWLYTHCAPNVIPSAGGMQIQCPNATSVQKFVAAIKSGIVNWHAFPTNAELELMTDATIQAQVQFVHQMDDEFGVPRKIVLSQRDVPGIPAGGIQSLIKQGVKAVSVGVNGGSAPPAVPSIFRWKDPANTNLEIIGMSHPGGYGSNNLDDVVYIDGWNTILYFNWNGDNAGPQDSKSVVKLFQDLSSKYPNAQIQCATFDEYINELEKVNVVLPIIQSEIGDTWIWGVASDPKKTQLIRQLNREITSLFFSGKWNPTDPATRKLVLYYAKTVEHTWGMDYKSYLNDTTNWNNDKFYKVKNTAPYQTLTSSWVEQRAYLDAANEILQSITNRNSFEEIELANKGYWPPATPQPIPTKEIPLDHKEYVKCGDWEIGFAPTGEIISLVSLKENIVIFDGSHILQYSMTTYTEDDMVKFFSTYGYNCVPQCPSWFAYDFGKQGLQSAQTVHSTYTPSSASVSQGANCSFKVTMNMSPNLYGAPSTVVLNLNLYDNSTFAMLFSLNNKNATRMPEAHWLGFSTVPVQNSKWYINKVNADYAYDNVVTNGTKHYHGHWSGARYNTPQYTYNIQSFDTGVLSVGSANPFPLPLDSTPDDTKGIFFNLVNNIWGTNYVQWYPFDDADSTFGFRFIFTINSNN